MAQTVQGKVGQDGRRETRLSPGSQHWAAHPSGAAPGSSGQGRFHDPGESGVLTAGGYHKREARGPTGEAGCPEPQPQRPRTRPLQKERGTCKACLPSPSTLAAPDPGLGRTRSPEHGQGGAGSRVGAAPVWEGSPHPPRTPGSTPVHSRQPQGRGVGQMPDAAPPVEPGQQQEAQGHVQQHRSHSVGLPGREVRPGGCEAAGTAWTTGGGLPGQRGSAWYGGRRGRGRRARTRPRRRDQGRPAPHQLGRVLCLLRAEDEREVLQPVPELFTRGKLAPEEGQGPQLEHPAREQRGGMVPIVQTTTNTQTTLQAQQGRGKWEGPSAARRGGPGVTGRLLRAPTTQCTRLTRSMASS
ncbi:hypothetical protein AAY473_040438 [Plecturocebus cupreus]